MASIEELINAQRKKMHKSGITPEGYAAAFGERGEEIFIADLTELVWLIFGTNMDKELVNRFVMEVLRASKMEEKIP